jgi:hypothetical protein
MSETAKGFLAVQAAAVGAPAPLTYPDAQSRPLSLGGLIPYFDEFVPRFLRKKNGAPVGRRAAQKIARQYNLPIVRMGHCAFIDVERAAEILREAQLVDRAPRKPGRPAALMPRGRVR